MRKCWAYCSISGEMLVPRGCVWHKLDGDLVCGDSFSSSSFSMAVPTKREKKCLSRPGHGDRGRREMRGVAGAGTGTGDRGCERVCVCVCGRGCWWLIVCNQLPAILFSILMQHSLDFRPPARQIMVQ